MSKRYVGDSLKLSVNKIICKPFGHLWTNPSTVTCYHKCSRCYKKEYWCRQMEIITSDNRTEVSKCRDCGGKETIVGGSLTHRERDTEGLWED